MTDQRDEEDMAVSGTADAGSEAAGALDSPEMRPAPEMRPGETAMAAGHAPAGAGSTRTEHQNLAIIMGVPVKMQVVLGAATMPVASLLKLGCGAVVELDRKVGEPVAITINERVIARGEVVVVDDDRFGVTLTDIVSEPIPGIRAAGF